MDDKEYELVTLTLKRLAKLDLTGYKDQQMRRRITSYIALQGSTVRDFCDKLAFEPDGVRKLKEFITINVSEFFRDQAQFQLLRDRILPSLLRERGHLNVWSAGCSIGAEPYSIAMMLQDMAPGERHRIVGTDLDNVVLAKARLGGPYTEADLRSATKLVRTKYFTPSEEGFMVKLDAIPAVDFRTHDLLRDNYERGFDLILCRNVIIYFTDSAKNKVMGGFSHSLSSGGMLFIGATDSLLNAQDLGLSQVSPCFFRRPGKQSMRAAA